MDGRRFDAWTRLFARRAGRRPVLATLAGGLGVALSGAGLGPLSAAAQQAKPYMAVNLERQAVGMADAAPRPADTVWSDLALSRATLQLYPETGVAGMVGIYTSDLVSPVSRDGKPALSLSFGAYVFDTPLNDRSPEELDQWYGALGLVPEGAGDDGQLGPIEGADFSEGYASFEDGVRYAGAVGVRRNVLFGYYLNTTEPITADEARATVKDVAETSLARMPGPEDDFAAAVSPSSYMVFPEWFSRVDDINLAVRYDAGDFFRGSEESPESVAATSNLYDATNVQTAISFSADRRDARFGQTLSVHYEREGASALYAARTQPLDQIPELGGAMQQIARPVPDGAERTIVAYILPSGSGGLLSAGYFGNLALDSAMNVDNVAIGDDVEAIVRGVLGDDAFDDFLDHSDQQFACLTRVDPNSICRIYGGTSEQVAEGNDDDDGDDSGEFVDIARVLIYPDDYAQLGVGGRLSIHDGHYLNLGRGDIIELPGLRDRLRQAGLIDGLCFTISGWHEARELLDPRTSSVGWAFRPEEAFGAFQEAQDYFSAFPAVRQFDLGNAFAGRPYLAGVADGAPFGLPYQLTGAMAQTGTAVFAFAVTGDNETLVRDGMSLMLDRLLNPPSTLGGNLSRQILHPGGPVWNSRSQFNFVKLNGVDQLRNGMTDAQAALNASRFRDQRDVLQVTYDHDTGRDDAAAGLNIQLHTFDDIDLSAAWVSDYQTNFQRDFGVAPEPFEFGGAIRGSDRSGAYLSATELADGVRDNAMIVVAQVGAVVVFLRFGLRTRDTADDVLNGMFGDGGARLGEAARPFAEEQVRIVSEGKPGLFELELTYAF